MDDAYHALVMWRFCVFLWGIIPATNKIRQSDNMLYIKFHIFIINYSQCYDGNTLILLSITLCDLRASVFNCSKWQQLSKGILLVFHILCANIFFPIRKKRWLSLPEGWAKDDMGRHIGHGELQGRSFNLLEL